MATMSIQYHTLLLGITTPNSHLIFQAKMNNSLVDDVHCTYIPHFMFIKPVCNCPFDQTQFTNPTFHYTLFKMILAFMKLKFFVKLHATSFELESSQLEMVKIYSAKLYTVFSKISQIVQFGQNWPQESLDILVSITHIFM